MMDHYVDIKIIPSLGFSKNTVMGQLFSMLHNALVEFGYGKIGISFPRFGQDLGETLRLHGSLTLLESLMSHSWLVKLDDYIITSTVMPIPKNVRYRTVKRVQAKSSAERLRRRSVQKGLINEEEALVKIPAMKAKKLSLPYLHVKSHSTGQSYRVFVEHGPMLENPIVEEFSSYGLSAKATIPWF